MKNIMKYEKSNMYYNYGCKVNDDVKYAGVFDGHFNFIEITFYDEQQMKIVHKDFITVDGEVDLGNSDDTFFIGWFSEKNYELLEEEYYQEEI